MLSTTMHQLLANASDSIGPAIFEGQGFRRHVERALDETGRRERRRRGLTATTVVLFVVFMSLYRTFGIRNVLKELISLARERFPTLGLRAVTPEAVCHARVRLGVEPVRAIFESLAAEIFIAGGPPTCSGSGPRHGQAMIAQTKVCRFDGNGPAK